jgi:hypothetical protein
MYMVCDSRYGQAPDSSTAPLAFSYLNAIQSNSDRGMTTV